MNCVRESADKSLHLTHSVGIDELCVRDCTHSLLKLPHVFTLLADITLFTVTHIFHKPSVSDSKNRWSKFHNPETILAAYRILCFHCLKLGETSDVCKPFQLGVLSHFPNFDTSKGTSYQNVRLPATLLRCHFYSHKYTEMSCRSNPLKLRTDSLSILFYLSGRWFYLYALNASASQLQYGSPGTNLLMNLFGLDSKHCTVLAHFTVFTGVGPFKCHTP